MKRPLAAHIREDEAGKVPQTVAEHVVRTADKASQFAAVFGHGDLGFLLGLFHDIGKIADAFQRRIWDNVGKADHSSAGAILVNQCYKVMGKILAYCIAGHHGGLPNGGSSADSAEGNSLAAKLQRQELLDDCSHYPAVLEGIVWPENPSLNLKPTHSKEGQALGESVGFTLAFFTRMLYSCLVDSDYLDTETFMKGQERPTSTASIADLLKSYRQSINQFSEPKTNLDEIRNQILRNCLAEGTRPQGIFSLTVPTGGGKTCSSLGFALTHAQEHGLRRVIYVIPYTSIIEQNAEVFRGLVGKEHVLEHHSAFDLGTPNPEDKEQADCLALAAENWDIPLVVTTNVQFFESLFANKSSRCRKLHNLADSVIIFDEAQMLPTEYLKPCLMAINELVTQYGCTAVLCSATQPALDDFFPQRLKPQEISPQTEKLHNFFKRAQLRHMGQLQDEELIHRLKAAPQVLCIVNSRRQAQALYEGVADSQGVFHLSTLMYPEHRKATLKEIRLRLEKTLPCKVISTSLIEAGVDVDFPLVYRAEAGIDSQIQAAGRCNREGKKPLEESLVYIFAAEEKYNRHLAPGLKRPKAIAGIIQKQYPDVTRPEAIRAYFQSLYHSTGTGLDSKDILQTLANGGQGLNIPFAEIAEKFKLIEENTYAVVIPVNADVRRALIELEEGKASRASLRLLQHYSVNIFPPAFKALAGVGGVALLGHKKNSQMGFLTDLSRYDSKKGLIIPENGGEAIFC